MVFFTAFYLVSTVTTTASAAKPVPGKARLGINLAVPKDYNTDLPFVDVFRFSRKWISQQEGKPFGKGPALNLDEHGWVKSLQPGCRADTVLFSMRDGHYPSGQYTILYDGQGKMDVLPKAKIVRQKQGEVVIDVKRSRGNFFLRIHETNPADYIRNIRVIMPGSQNTYKENPWNPEFLARWKGFACLRFMDFMRTNNSEIKTWADRPKMEDSNWSTHGVPLEMMCDLANRMACDPWFCMPHEADDEYVRKFARQASELIDRDRKVYIEYSNEVWNGGFRAHTYSAERGRQLGFAEKTWEAAWAYTAYRSKQIFKIWEEEFGGRQRLVRVLASQAAVPTVSKRVLSFQDAYRSADALAIAPYINWNVKRADAETVVSRGLDAILDELESERLPKAMKKMQDQKAVADNFGVQLIAYESGQHLVGIRGAENNDQLTELLHQVNRHPRMGEIYRRYYDAWEEAGGDLNCAYSSIAQWSKWGSWGLMEFADDRPEDNPKFLSTLEWASRHGQKVQLPRNSKAQPRRRKPRRR